MRIVFGWNSLKVRSFTLDELGIMKNLEPGTELEVRQAYFHLFWIPFFGLGKRWIVRKGDKMYEMPAEIKALARNSLTNVKTPWYTFTGPILIVAGLIIFSIATKVERMQDHKRSVARFNEEAKALDEKLHHLTTNDFITVEKMDGINSYELYLKVEDINGDDIAVTPVICTSDKPMIVENEYTKHAGTLPSVKMSYKNLLSAFPKEYDSSRGAAAMRQGTSLLNDGENYVVKDVVRHFKPIVKVNFANFYTGTINIRCYNEGWPATITEMKNLVGNIDWSQMINTDMPGRQSNYSSQYTLDGTNYKRGEPYKFVMTLKDTTGHSYKYEFENKGSNNVVIREL
ncbi:hypothetical protein [Niastella populi]|uniref:Uncharacterized protein n=1 Tax=Niastella populi TaxID=550983 RepID=A0A1V9EVQ5_9BACT|nr:hypothetical protein [Niastella populi]OQP50256.1 hypothetical protein A4R26_29975 [Niastella populi]